MDTERPKDTAWLDNRHNYSGGLYAEPNNFAVDVEDVWKADFAVPEDLADAQLSVVRPPHARNIVDQVHAMLGVRSKIGIKVIALPELTDGRATQQELRKCAMLERGCKAYIWTINRQHSRDLVRDAVYWVLLRGRACFETRFRKPSNGNHTFPVQTYVADPMTIFPVWGPDGIDWYTKEYELPVAQAADYLRNMSGQRSVPKALLAEEDENGNLPYDRTARVVEFWNSKWSALTVADEFVGPMEHDYGFVPLSEFRIKETPIASQRWAYNSFIGPVLDMLKGEAEIMAKAQAGFELFFYPRLLYKTATGQPMVVSSTDDPSAWEAMSPDTDPIVLNPKPNQELLQQMMAYFQGQTSQGTLPEIAFVQEIPHNVSGFTVSQILSQIQDKLDDVRYSIERGIAEWLGQVLRLVEQFGDLEDMTLPGFVSEEVLEGNRRSFVTLTPEDVAGHHWVEVEMRVQLPTDKLQLATLANQLRAQGPDGKPFLDWDTVMDVVELVDDPAGVKERRDREWIEGASPEVQQAKLEMLAAEWLADHADEMDKAQQKMAGQARKVQAKQARRAEREADKELEEGVDSPVVIPAEKKLDPAIYQKMAMLALMGQDPALALEEAFGEEPLPAAPPEMPGGIPGPGPEEPRTPFEGIEGIDTTVAPPAVLGALPRRDLDKGELFVEGAERDMRRGALPPPK